MPELLGTGDIALCKHFSRPLKTVLTRALDFDANAWTQNLRRKHALISEVDSFASRKDVCGEDFDLNKQESVAFPSVHLYHVPDCPPYSRAVAQPHTMRAPSVASR
jgi:hypothetical protein